MLHRTLYISDSALLQRYSPSPRVHIFSHLLYFYWENFLFLYTDFVLCVWTFCWHILSVHHAFHITQSTHRYPGNEDPCGCEPPWRCWELNPHPLEEQSVVLIAESPFSPRTFYFHPVEIPPCRYSKILNYPKRWTNLNMIILPQ